MSNGTRPQVTSITVWYDDGTGKTYPNPKDGYMPEALFWSDHAIIEILGAYYENPINQRDMTYEKLLERFGKVRADAVCPAGPGNSVKLDKNVITTIWNTVNPPTMLGSMSKDPSCDIGG